jgi:hypothetical protein
MMASTLERSWKEWTKWTTIHVRQLAELLHDTCKSHDNLSTQQFANQARCPFLKKVQPVFSLHHKSCVGKLSSFEKEKFEWNSIWRVVDLIYCRLCSFFLSYRSFIHSFVEFDFCRNSQDEDRHVVCDRIRGRFHILLCLRCQLPKRSASRCGAT